MFIIINKITIFVYNNKHYGSQEIGFIAISSQSAEGAWRKYKVSQAKAKA